MLYNFGKYIYIDLINATWQCTSQCDLAVYKSDLGRLSFNDLVIRSRLTSKSQSLLSTHRVEVVQNTNNFWSKSLFHIVQSGRNKSEMRKFWKSNSLWSFDNRFEVNWPPEATLVLRWISKFFLFGALPSDTLKIKHTKNLKEIPSRHVLENLPEKACMNAFIHLKLISNVQGFN